MQLHSVCGLVVHENGGQAFLSGKLTRSEKAAPVDLAACTCQAHVCDASIHL